MSALADLPLLCAGKVRELFELGPADDGSGELVLVVASDRISTYDAVHPTPVALKGAVLTALSAFWFARTSVLVPNHLVSVREGVPHEVRGRALVARRLEMLGVECVVRGYLAGSGWRDYQATGAVAGIALPPGLREGDPLPTPIFTPATKAQGGEHDETIDFEAFCELVGDRGRAERLRSISLGLYRIGAYHCRDRALLLADTKFEFGLDARGDLTLGDELLTPDSSRLWAADRHAPGGPQSSFDKQPVRDWAAGTGWNRLAPAPALPSDVVAATTQRYRRAYEVIAGEPLDRWLERTGARTPAGAST